MSIAKRITAMVVIIALILIGVMAVPGQVYAETRAAWVTVTEGVEGGAIYIDWSIKAIKNADRTITKVIVPDGVQSVDLRNCANLTEVVLPDSVTSVAFQNCSSLKSIVLPRKVTEIGTQAFENCTSLETVILSEGLTTIYQKAFVNCTSLKEIRMPSTLTSLANDVFAGCGSLKAVKNFENTKITRMRSGTFSGCVSLEAIKFPPTLRETLTGSFRNCVSLERVVFPEGVTWIEENSFTGCTGLKYVDLPESFNNTLWYPFKGCAIEEVVIRGTQSYGFLTRCFNIAPKVMYGQINSGAHEYARNSKITFQPLSVLDSKKELYGDDTIKITVVDEKDQPINDAQVKYGNTVYEANHNGIVCLEANKNIKTAEVSAPCYLSIEIPVEYDNEFLTKRVMLRSADGAKITGVYVTFEGQKCDVLTESLCINKAYPLYDLDFEIKTAGDVSVIENHVLYQKDPNSGKQDRIKIERFGDGVLEKVQVNNLKIDNELYVVIQGAHGEVLDSLPLQIQILTSIGEDDVPPIEIRGLEIVIPEDFPVLSGKSYTIDFDLIPISVQIEKDRILYGINLPKGESELTEKFGFGGTYGNIELDLERHLEAIRGEIAEPSHDPISVDIQVIGLAESTLSNQITGGVIYIITTISVSTGEQNTAIGVIPMVYELTGELTLKGGGKIIRLSPGLRTDMGIEGIGTIGAYGGVGASDLASAGVYGEGYVSSVVDATESIEIDNIKVGGSLSLQARLVSMKYTYEVVNGEWYLYNRNGSPVTPYMFALLDEEAMMTAYTDTSSYSFIQRSDYADYTSGWYTEAPVPMLLTADAMDDALKAGNESISSTQVLKSGVYIDAAPQMVEAGGQKVLLYLEDSLERANADMSTLMYSVYDDIAGIWSVPAAVDDDGTADFGADVYSDGQTLSVVWQDATQLLSETMTLEEVAASVELNTAVFDPVSGQFTAKETITENEIFEGMPQIAMDGQQLSVIWTESAADDLFGLNGSRIMKASRTMNGWITEEIETSSSMIMTMDAGQLDGRMAAAWATDESGWIYTGGQTTQVAMDKLYDARFEKVAGCESLIWYNKGSLLRQTGAYETPAVLYQDMMLQNKNYDIVSGDDTYLIYAADEGGKSNLYASKYNPLTSDWSDPLAVTAQNFYTTDCFGAMEDSSLQVVYAQRQYIQGADVSQDVEVVSLCESIVDLESRVTIESAECTDLELTPGGMANLEVVFANKGIGETDVLTLVVQNSAGETVLQQGAGTLKGNSTGEMTVAVPLAAEATQQTFTISILSGGEVLAQTTAEAGYADFEVSASSYHIGDDNVVHVNVVNTGMGTGSGTVILKTVPGDEVISSFEFTDLESGGGMSQEILVDSKYFGGEKHANLMVVVESDDKQMRYGNDTAYTVMLDYVEAEEDVTVPEAAKCRTHSIALKKVAGYEYRMGDGSWQTSPVFEGLKAGTEYAFYQRKAGSEDYLPSKTSKPAYFTTLAEGTETGMPGDVNLDGDITAADLTTLARHVAKIELVEDPEALYNGDVMPDGDLTAEDLTKLARYVAKIIDTL